MQEFPRTLKLVTVWLVIGVAVFVGARAWQSYDDRTRFEATGGVIEIRRSRDGHYHWPGSVNGRRVDFLIDTGATTTALPLALADELKLPTLGHVRSATANGVATGTLTRADITLDGGVHVANLRVVALSGLGDFPLLGMNVLSRLHWRQSGDRLLVEAAAR